MSEKSPKQLLSPAEATLAEDVRIMSEAMARVRVNDACPELLATAIDSFEYEITMTEREDDPYAELRKRLRIEYLMPAVCAGLVEIEAAEKTTIH